MTQTLRGNVIPSYKFQAMKRSIGHGSKVLTAIQYLVIIYTVFLTLIELELRLNTTRRNNIYLVLLGQITRKVHANGVIIEKHYEYFRINYFIHEAASLYYPR